MRCAFLLLIVLACSSKSTILTDVALKETEARLPKVLETARKRDEKHATDLIARAGRLASIPEVATALATEAESDRSSKARLGFMKFIATDPAGRLRPDILAIVDAAGNVVAMHEVPTAVPRQWRAESSSAKTVFPALDRALISATQAGDVVSHSGSLFRIGAASVVADGKVIGAVVLFEAFSEPRARAEADAIREMVAFVDGDRVIASSAEDPALEAELSKWLASKPAGAVFTIGSELTAREFVTASFAPASATSRPALRTVLLLEVPRPKVEE